MQRTKNIAEDLYAISVALRQFFRTPSDMSTTALQALAMIECEGEVKITRLAEAQSVAQPTMTALINRFERDGLAERHSDNSDARSTLVGITKTGRALLQERRAEMRGHFASALEGLDKADQQLIAAALPAFQRLLAVHGEKESK